VRVKICGITTVEQGRAIAQLGATALGFICAMQSPRYVPPERIRAIVDALPIALGSGKPICDRVGVFVNASLDVIGQTVAIANLNAVQLHGNESPDFCDHLRATLPGIELLKALRIQTSVDLDAAIAYQSYVDTLLLDAYHPKLQGGTGKTLDWSMLRQFRPTIPWLLAGGLTPDNVLEALSQVDPDGIDLSSGVENAPGEKNLDQVAQLFNRLLGMLPT
jgi:phosphoribosylanthranilate isomerase